MNSIVNKLIPQIMLEETSKYLLKYKNLYKFCNHIGLISLECIGLQKSTQSYLNIFQNNLQVNFKTF